MRLPIVALLLATTTALTAAEPAWVGYGGPEGSRVYPDVTPPTKFGDKDIVWKTEIPELGWGHGSPIVVGDKVIIAAEYDERHNAFPSLLAFNIADGSLAWSALLDHTPALANGKRIAGKIYSKGRGAVPETSHLLCRAGDHIYGLKNAGDKKHQHGIFGVWTPDGKQVAVNKLSNPLGKGYFSYGCTFTFDKSSIYVRSLRHIMKIGK